MTAMDQLCRTLDLDLMRFSALATGSVCALVLSGIGVNAKFRNAAVEPPEYGTRQDLLSRHLRSPNDRWRQHKPVDSLRQESPKRHPITQDPERTGADEAVDESMEAESTTTEPVPNSSMSSWHERPSMHLASSDRLDSETAEMATVPRGSEAPLLPGGSDDAALAFSSTDSSSCLSDDLFDQFDAFFAPDCPSQDDIVCPPPPGTGQHALVHELGDNRREAKPGIGTVSSSSSRLPSVAAAAGERVKRHSIPSTNFGTRHGSAEPCWRLSDLEYSSMADAIYAEHNLLAPGFVFPSRNAISRYLEGYFTGFHSQLALIHLPTLSLACMSPALLLAISAMGAQYRFERDVALDLYCAAKALTKHRVTARAQPSCLFMSSDQSSQGYHYYYYYTSATSTAANESFITASAEGRDAHNLELAQALVNLIVFTTYHRSSLLQDAFEMEDWLVRELRESGIMQADDSNNNNSSMILNSMSMEETWQQWSTIEARRRTAFGAFVCLNLLSVLYNVPPKLMIREIRGVRLPAPEEQWSARSAAEWCDDLSERQADRRASPITLGEAYAALFDSGFCSGSDPSLPVRSNGASSFGSLVLIHAMLQQIGLAWELTSAAFPMIKKDNTRTLPPTSLATLANALDQWRRQWELPSRSAIVIDPLSRNNNNNNNNNTSTAALFRIACVRLHYNLRPYLRLETRDPWIIAHALRAAPPPEQRANSSHHRAVLQSAHALSIPVRQGVQFVARTQAFTWSVADIVSLAECTLFLSKWLERTAAEADWGTTICARDQRLVEIVGGLLRDEARSTVVEEASFPAEPGGGRNRIKRMAVEVVRVLASMLRGKHVFGLVDVVCAALDTYAVLLEYTI
ncbi:hypothetical protein BJY01DRAFT_245667 [Aspergillus pseudoustus]|uniref:Xylanolytic transcriptional activator regulatory domain-containing protein n=1 Tax=Aspergillus pseudoustus TaxID=1810923 RepID=A0ABR4KD47_9EURO